MRDGQPGYVTLVDNVGLGLVYDIRRKEIVIENLSYPRDCLWHEGRLYLLESGTGYIGEIDLESREFIKERFLPGFLRGLTVVDKCLVVGSSFDRYESLFLGTSLGATLKKEKVQDRCGVYVVSLENWDVIHSFMILGGLFEIDAVSFIETKNRDMTIFELSLPDNYMKTLEI